MPPVGYEVFIPTLIKLCVLFSYKVHDKSSVTVHVQTQLRCPDFQTPQLAHYIYTLQVAIVFFLNNYSPQDKHNVIFNMQSCRKQKLCFWQVDPPIYHARHQIDGVVSKQGTFPGFTPSYSVISTCMYTTYLHPRSTGLAYRIGSGVLTLRLQVSQSNCKLATKLH